MDILKGIIKYIKIKLRQSFKLNIILNKHKINKSGYLGIPRIRQP